MALAAASLHGRKDLYNRLIGKEESSPITAFVPFGTRSYCQEYHHVLYRDIYLPLYGLTDPPKFELQTHHKLESFPPFFFFFPHKLKQHFCTRGTLLLLLSQLGGGLDYSRFFFPPFFFLSKWKLLIRRVP